MANVTSTIDKKTGGFFGVDKNEVPVGWQWNVNRTLVFDDGSSTTIVVQISFTDDELAKHVSDALVKQAADIAADSQERDTLKAALAEKNSALNAALAAIPAEKDNANV